jgi:hypothetical protein
MGGGVVVGVRIFFVVAFRVPRQKYMHREEYAMKKREIV